MKVKFITFGCKVNQYETQALKEGFFSRNHEVVDSKADLYVINTCTVTSHADSKSKQAVYRAKRENPKAKIALCGCLVQGNKDIGEKLGVDYIIPQDAKHSLTDIILDGSLGDKDVWSLKINGFVNYRAFVKIQDGCDNFCSFCKIPYVRGRSISRENGEIIEEIKRLCSRHKEIVLCGVNAGLYGKDFNPQSSLAELLKGILKIDFLKRVRLSSLDPALVDDSLIGLLSHDKLCPHLHYPFQSGDDGVLKDMNKRETRALYEELVKKSRQSNPLTAISCDIMAGFPTEDDKRFQNTLDFLEKVRPMRAHIFTFSPRQGTPFYGMKIRNQGVIRKRYESLRELSRQYAFEYKSAFLGKTLYMIAEEEQESGWVSGCTENYIKVYVKDKVSLGEIYPVKIEKVKGEKVYAKLVNS